MVKYMAFIYKITNSINDKIYVGNTSRSLKKRFQEHCSDSKKEKFKHRPLYQDMNEFGIDKFQIELIEENNGNPNEREIYWIDKLNSRIPNGYNTALGGLGKKMVTKQEEEEIIQLYKNGNSILNIKNITKKDCDTITRILKDNNMEIKKTSSYLCKKIGQYDDNWNLIAIYENILETEKKFSKSKSHSHINSCCNGKRKKAYGYHWKYIEE